MNKIEKIEKLQKEIAFWQDKLNRSRKESLRSIRALHLSHAQDELQKLEEQTHADELAEAVTFFDDFAKDLPTQGLPVSADQTNFSLKSWR